MSKSMEALVIAILTTCSVVDVVIYIALFNLVTANHGG